MRGEKYRGVELLNTKEGSPPLARGKVAVVVLSEVGKRITPACAGKSGVVKTKVEGRGDHPRLRGEKSNVLSENTVMAGSPPLARGKE